MKLKNNSYRLSLFLASGFLALFCTTCLDPFPLPDVSGGLLVVEGTFTNDPGANMVKLSFAGNVNEGGLPVSGASVSVSDNLGNSGEFREEESGRYIPVNENFIGIEGRKYVLHVWLDNGRQYRSDSCLFREVPPIDELRWDLKQQPTLDNSRMLNGIEIYLDTHDPENRVQHYLWKYDEVWENSVPYPISDIYLGDGKFQAVDNGTACFLESGSREILMESTTDLSESRVKDKALIFISSETSRLWRRYLIRVRQFGLTEEAFFYHQKLQELTGQNGSIFDVQPFTLRGNVRNTAAPDEIVMGYFIVSGVSIKTLTVGRYQLPPEYKGINPEQTICWQTGRAYPHSATINFENIVSWMWRRRQLVFVGRIWESNIDTGEDEVVGYQFALEECTTCSGTSEKPEEWE
jgi:hypothetical protein